MWQFNYDALLPKNKITIVSKKNDKKKERDVDAESDPVISKSAAQFQGLFYCQVVVGPGFCYKK